MKQLIFVSLFAFFSFTMPALAEHDYDILLYGDSLMAGYGLEKEEAFAAQLEEKLLKEHIHVNVINASISGDTTAGGLNRVDWVLSKHQETDIDLVIIGLGGNDLLRGLSPEATKENLRKLIKNFSNAGLDIILAGMNAPPNLGPEFQAAFDSIYPALADEFENVTLYPFFLKDVALKPELNLKDGLHPNKAGTAIIVQNITPYIVSAYQEN